MATNSSDLYEGLSTGSDARKRMAMALLARGTDASPVQSWSQGAARLAQGLFGGMALRNAEEEEDAVRQREAGDMASALSTLRGGRQASNAPTAAPSSYNAAVSGAESAGDDTATNPNSTATGRYQFTEGTWNDLAKRRPDLGLTPDGRTNADQAERAMNAFSDENRANLKTAGFEATPGNLYLSHFAGPGGAVNVLRADPAAPVATVLGADAVTANPFLQSMTAGDLVKWAGRKVGGVQVASTDPGYVPEVPGSQPGVTAPPMGNVPLPRPRPDDAPESADVAVAPSSGLSPGGQKVAQAMGSMQPGAPVTSSAGAQRMMGDPAVMMRLLQSKNPGARALGESMMKAMQGSESYAQETDAQGNVWNVNRQTGKKTIELKADRSVQSLGDGYIYKDGAVTRAYTPEEKSPASVQEYEYYKKNFEPTEQQKKPMPYDTWATAKARAGAISVGNVTTNAGGGSDKQIYDTFDERAKEVRAVAAGLVSLREARAALEGAGGNITGAGAEGRLALQKIGAYFGAADPAKIQNTETFKAAIAPQVAAMIKSTVGTANISNSDRTFAEKAAGGSIDLDEGTIKRLMNIMEKASVARLQDHQEQLDAVYPDPVANKRERALFSIKVPTPAAPPAGATKSGVKWSVE